MNELDLFVAANAIADPAERAAYLDRVCADRPELRQRLEALLAGNAQSRHPLDQPPSHPPAPADATRTFGDPAATGSFRPAPSAEEAEGVVIAGRYKLRQQIGEGGMGTVWLAEQTEPVKRKVAVKLIRVERGQSKTILARFEAERQAIALMDHPHIAKLLDAGTSETGAPFFVMELVKGVPLTEFCDQHKLTIAERLNLFTQICSAVQHAHQKGVIHRDLKPGNILVESHDGKPVPKVIDFGLAKATTGLQLTDQSMFTAFGSVMGTPLYMAPEQASFNAVDVDTRADVYALGVILYELLTGTTPLTKEALKRAALDEMLRLVREQEAPMPSSRLSSADSTPSVAASRQIEPAKLGRFVKGELDWIVLKALSKDRDRRYESATSFAKDIERFLNHEPVQAGPVGTAYKLRKFVRRNRGQVIAASLVLLALVAGVIGTALGLVEARRQEAEAKKQEQLAKAETVEKERARQEAERLATDNAKLATDEQEAKKAALDAKQETERQLRRIEAVLFSNQMAKAGEVAPQNPAEATKLLYDMEAIPIHLRDAAWRALARSCERRVQRIDLHDIVIEPTTTVSLDGSRAVVRKVRDDERGERVLATVTVHDIPSGKVLLEIPEEQDAEFTFNVLSADGSKFAQIVDPKARLKPADPKAPFPAPRYTRYLAGGTLDVRVWDVPSGKVVFTYTMPPDVTGVKCAFGPDGRLLAVTDAGHAMKIWDIPANRAVTTLKGHAEPITTVAISRDGKRIATAGNDFTLKLWDGVSGELIADLTPANDNTTPEFLTERKRALVTSKGKPVRDFVLGLDFSPDGSSLAASYSNWLIEVWDVAKGKSKDVLRGLKQRPGVVLYDAAGKSLFVGGHSRWDVASGQMLFTLNLSEQMASAGKPVISTDRTRWGTLQGRRITWVGGDDPARDAAKFELPGTAESVRKMTFSPDNQLLAVPCENRIELIDRRAGKLLPTLTGPKKTVSVVTFSPDGRTLAASCREPQGTPRKREEPNDPRERDDIYLFDMPSGRLLGVLPAREIEINALEFSPDGRTLASVAWRAATAGAPAPRSERHAAIVLWDVTTRTPKDALEFAAREAIPFGATALKFHPTNGTLAAAAGETVVLWDLATRTPRPVPLTSSGPRFVSRLDYSADGDTLFVAVPGIGGSTTDAVQCANLKTGESEIRFLGQGYFQGLTPDGKTAVLTTQTKATFWNTHTVQLLHTFHTGTSGVIAVAQDGRAIASVEHDPAKKTVAVKVWDTGDPERLVSLRQMTPVGFAPDSKTLVLKREDTVYVWDLQTHRVRRTVPTSRGTGAATRLSPDGRFVALSGGFGRVSQEGSIELFDLTSGAKVGTITGQGTRFQATPMAFSPDSRTLAFVHAVAGKTEGAQLPTGTATVNLWDIRENRLIRTIPLPPVTGGPSAGGNYGIAFARDGQALAVHTPDKTVHVSDLRDPALPAVVLPAPEADAQSPYFNGLAFTPDGARVAVKYVSNYGDLTRHIVWDWRSAKRVEGVAVANLFAPRIPNSMASPDGRFEAVSELGGCYLIDRSLYPKK